MRVYLLQHSFEHEICEDVKTDETKIIGIYTLTAELKRVPIMDEGS